MASCIKAIWTEREMEILRKYYSDSSNSELQKLIPGKSPKQICTKANFLGLLKSKAFLQKAGYVLAEHGHSTRFKKGHIPHSKGKKQTDFMSPEAIERTKATRFKKGQRSLTWRPKGSERINVEGYVEIKTDDVNKWELKHRVIWKEYYGPIPDGCNIRFINGNKSDIRIENLSLVSNQDNMRQNSIMRYPNGIRRLIKAQKKLEKTINKKENE